MADLVKHSVSVAGVVVDAAGRVLVIRRRDTGEWQIPGGVLELAESFEDGVRREVAEETGVVVEVGRLTGVYKNLELGVVALVFRCGVRSGVARVTEEAGEVRWVSREEACARMTPAFAVRVADAFGSQPGVRVHDGVEVLRSGFGQST